MENEMIASIRNRVKKLEAYREKRESIIEFFLVHSDKDLEQKKASFIAEHGVNKEYVFFIMHLPEGDTHEKPCEPN